MGRFRFAVLAAMVFLSACSSRNLGGVPTGPVTDNSRSRASAAASNSIPNIFAAAQNLVLTPAEIDAYIDPTVQGNDRAIAEYLMSIMPPNMRGDFVYTDHQGKLISNNVALLRYMTDTFTNAIPGNGSRTASTQGKHRLDYSSSCSPPNPPSSPGGAYARQVSLCAFTAGAAFINVPCGDTSFQPGDNGDLYFELRGYSGSLAEGGFQYNNDSSIQPYLRSTAVGSGGYETLSGGNQHFTCGENIGVFHGMTANAQYTYTSAGQLPSNLQPQTNFYNGQQFTFQNQEWLFGKAASDYSESGTDPLGNATPCTGCSISRVTSIAQGNGVTQYAFDGSYFGVDNNGYNAINWMQVAFGEYESNCEPGTSLCTFDYSSTPSRYYGGAQYYPNADVSGSDVDPNASYGPYESYDGIDLTGDSASSSKRAPEGSFSEPLPPSPTPKPVPTPTPPPVKKCGSCPCPSLSQDNRKDDVACPMSKISMTRRRFESDASSVDRERMPQV
jgi:hypothetical protein